MVNCYFQTDNDPICGKCKNCKSLEHGLKDVKEGRTYTFSCSHKSRNICSDCLVKDCRRWYKIGVKDGRKRQAKNKKR